MELSIIERENGTKDFILIKDEKILGRVPVKDFKTKKSARAHFEKKLKISFPSPLEKIKVKPINTVLSSYNNIRFHTLKGQTSHSITFRGQPRENCGGGVTRLVFSKGRWDFDSPYMWDGVISSSSVECQIEGTVNKVKELWLHSESKGWITIKVEKNNFEVSEKTAINKRYQWPVPHLETPTDITDVFVK